MQNMFRFIHSSDLHLGKRFGNFEGDLPSRLREARHGVIRRLADLAREHGATTILLAGDTFDTETPAPDIRRQALAEMSHHAPIQWVILPGNHDSLQASQLWASLRGEAPGNVVLAAEPRPIELGKDAVLLPSPCTTRRPGRDLTEWMDGVATGEGVVRLGLAHGAIQSFSEDASAADTIAPDRARRAGLDYLALGDWHGSIAVDPRTHYSGTPEPDRFKHDRPGQALLVSIAGAGAAPEVLPLETASFAWRTLPLHLLSEDDASAALASLLPEARLRRQSLIRIEASGHCRLAARTALGKSVEQSRPDFALLELDDAALATECETTDLDLIDRAGALREAANTLLAEAGDPARSAAERDISQGALNRLFALCEKIAS
jgi:DNA repair exonuclease SbcCD nuclease subunit